MVGDVDSTARSGSREDVAERRSSLPGFALAGRGTDEASAGFDGFGGLASGCSGMVHFGQMIQREWSEISSVDGCLKGDNGSSRVPHALARFVDSVAMSRIAG